MDDYLKKVADADRQATLHRLVRSEVAHRVRRGEAVRAEEYKARFPELETVWLAWEFDEDSDLTPGLSAQGTRAASGQGPPEARPAPAVLLCPNCHNGMRPCGAGDQQLVCAECGGSFRVEDVSRLTVVQGVRRLGRFHLLERIGQGSFGAVWRARDTDLQRIVALKVPHAGVFQALSEQGRILREARAAAQLRHPGIVRLYEVATLDGVPVLVSDFIDGVSLKDLLGSRPLTFRQAAALAAEIAEALDYAHGRGLVHRDVKPGNVMVERQAGGPLDSVGRPVLVDFGLALRQEAEIVMTVEGQIIGTPAYMSPEQADGRGHAVDRTSDVYSLGVVLYEMLCGELPFRGSKAMMIHQVLHEEPRPPRRVNDKIPRDLDTICLKALAKEPRGRYATAQQLADDLRRFLRCEPIRARAVGPAERAWRWCRRNPTVAVSSGLAATALLAATVVSVVYAAHEKQHSQDISHALEQSEGYRRQAERRVVERDLDQGLDLCAQGDVGQGLLWLVRGLEDAPEGAEDLTRVIRINLAAWRPRLGRLRRVLESANDDRVVALGPGGRFLLTAGSEKACRLWDSASGEALGPACAHPERVTGAAVSRNGASVVTACADGYVRRWESATGRVIGPPVRLPGAVSALARLLLAAGGEEGAYVWYFLPSRARGPSTVEPVASVGLVISLDGKRVLSGTGEEFGEPSAARIVRLWDVASGRLLRELSHPMAVGGMDFSPDGRVIATACNDSKARLWDAADGRVMDPPLQQPEVIHSVAFAGEGRWLVTGGADKTARAWDIETRRPVGAALTHAGAVRLMCPVDGVGRMVTVDSLGVARLWEIPETRPGSHVLRHRGVIMAAAFSLDGSRVWTASGPFTNAWGEAQLWSCATGRRLGLSLSHQGIPTAGAFSPDGRRVLSADGKGFVRLAEVSTATPGPSLHHDRWITGAVFSPDGKLVLTSSEDNTARLWDATTGRPRGKPLAHPWIVTKAAFSPDGRTIITGSTDGGVRVWDSTSQTLRFHRSHGGYVIAIAFSPDGRTAITGSTNGTARLWDTGTGHAIGPPLVHQDRIHAVGFDSEGKLALTASDDGTARLWDARSGEPRGVPFAHKQGIHAACFSPDGRMVLTGSLDKTGRLWDVATGRQLGPPLEHDQLVRAVAFSPDGRTMLTGSEDQTARLWSTPAEVSGETSRLRLWVQVMTGMELDAHDVIRVLRSSAWDERRRQLDELGVPGEDRKD